MKQFNDVDDTICSSSEFQRLIILDSLFIILYTLIRSEHIRLSSSAQRPSICSLLLYGTSFRPGIMRVNLWIYW